MVSATNADTTDKQLGYSVIFGLLTLASLAVMVVAPGELLAAWGFAGAVVASMLLIYVLHTPRFKPAEARR